VLSFFLLFLLASFFSLCTESLSFCMTTWHEHFNIFIENMKATKILCWWKSFFLIFFTKANIINKIGRFSYFLLLNPICFCMYILSLYMFGIEKKIAIFVNKKFSRCWNLFRILFQILIFWDLVLQIIVMNFTKVVNFHECFKDLIDVMDMLLDQEVKSNLHHLVVILTEIRKIQDTESWGRMLLPTYVQVECLVTDRKHTLLWERGFDPYKKRYIKFIITWIKFSYEN